MSEKGLIAAVILTFYLMRVWMRLWPSWKAETYSFDEMRGKCQEIVDQHNKILRSRGLKWSIPCQFPDWIELTKDMQRQNNEFEPTFEHRCIPPTTEATIVFPAQFFTLPTMSKRSRNYIFSSDFYSSEMTDERVSREEVQDFISEVNISYRKTLKSYTGEIPQKVVVLPVYLYMSSFILLAGISIHFPDLIGEEMFSLLAFALWAICSTFMFVRFRRLKNKQNTQIRAGCQKVVDKYNQALRNRGLRWHLSEKFPLWIELCKDYSSRTQLVDMPSFQQGSCFSAMNYQYDIEAQRQRGNQNYHKESQNEMYLRLLDEEN